jgi:hypothetical protein
VTERRKTIDRRSYDRLKDRTERCNRRVAPDRRLNNIAVEWIPFSYLHLHPVARLVFNRH